MTIVRTMLEKGCKSVLGIELSSPKNANNENINIINL